LTVRKRRILVHVPGQRLSHEEEMVWGEEHERRMKTMSLILPQEARESRRQKVQLLESAAWTAGSDW
jgi:hypothetical protein